jgi:ribosome-associated protein
MIQTSVQYVRPATEIPMARKPKKGYYVNGHFVAEGSELDIELKAELKGTTDKSRTDLKKDSDHRQLVGEALIDLRPKLLAGLELPDRLMQALADGKRIHEHGARRRHLQLIGKLMRYLDEETVQAAEQALQEQHTGSASEAAKVKLAEHWRDRLIEGDEAVTEWFASKAGAHTPDVQAFRSLVRQARKDLSKMPPPAEPVDGEAPKLAPKTSKAYKELFQQLRAALSQKSAPNGDARNETQGQDKGQGEGHDSDEDNGKDDSHD